MPTQYPYPKLSEDGYEFEVVEQSQSADHPFLRHAVPLDEDRYAAKPGDVVKLIFRYRDSVEKNGQSFTGEHMWVRVTDYGEGCLVGRLDNEPQFTSVLKSDQQLHFHPKHIVRFWSDEPKDA